jgi:hypothetical protein
MLGGEATISLSSVILTCFPALYGIWAASKGECSIWGPAGCQSGGPARIAWGGFYEVTVRNCQLLRVVARSQSTALEIDRLTYLSLRGGWYFCYCYG